MNVEDQIGVTFVNLVLSRGVYNGVVNISFGTYNFTPNHDNSEVDPDMVVSARLRMDIMCAQQLHESLGELLAALKTPAQPNGQLSEEKTTTGKPN
jgi:hypothetical protein